jgi:hypothetical protein
VALASLAAPHLAFELKRVFTVLQLVALFYIVYWIIETNTPKTFIWVLRSYVTGSLGTIALAYKTGATMISTAEASGRYSASLGRTINANMMAVLLGMAFLSAVYLIICDKKLFWRIIYMVAILFLPIMMIKTGSRGGLISLVFTLLSPLLFLKQVARKPAFAIFLVFLAICAYFSFTFLLKHRGLDENVQSRLTDVNYAKDSLAYRGRLIKSAVKMVAKYPAGTSVFGWFERTGLVSYPHNDFFYALGIYGIPGALIFLSFIFSMILTIMRIPFGVEKLFARAILTFLLISGSNITQLYTKHYWIFLAIVLTCERLGRLRTSTDELPPSIPDEENTYMP